MSDLQAPLPVPALVEAINSGDYDGFVATFAPDGRVDDWGNVRTGHEGVRSWAETDAIGADARMRLLSASTEGDVTEIRFDWASNKFTGDGHAFVTIRDRLISEFRIPAEH